MIEEQTVFQCCTPGLAGTTPTIVVQMRDGTFEARMGVAFFGSTNMNDKGFKKCGYNPFHPEFHDNYVHGFGPTTEDAIAALREDYAAMHESLWAF